jgi:uncharacterized protein (DUF1778 family)
MGRPRKNAGELLNVPLRILLTVEQKSLIEEAARLDSTDMASWARPILLEAARTRISETEKAKRKR